MDGHPESQANVTVKAAPSSDVASPADLQHLLSNRWARPLVFSGESNGGEGRSSGCCAGSGPLADGLELLDPARSVLLGAHGGIVDGLVEIGLAPRQQDVDQADHLVRHGHNGLFVRLAHHETSVLGRQRALGHA